MGELPRLSLAMGPTPVERLDRMSERLGLEVLVKRDDLTGSTLSGNKVRKLEYLLADARARGADVVVTCGGEQSNHCRATAIAARQLHLDSVLLLRTENPGAPPPPEANILLDRMVGAEIRWVSREEYRARAQHFVAIERELVAAGRRPYLIPEGGSNPLGSVGYVRCIDELLEQIGPEPATIVYAAGSGGTGAGLLLGVRLRALPWRVVGINVCDDREYFVCVIGEIIEEALRRFAPKVTFSREEIEIIDGYVGRGYARSRPEELSAMRDLARAEGLILDPVYTGKAWFGLLGEIAKRGPSAFGPRVVFLHSGGIYGLFPKSSELAPLL